MHQVEPDILVSPEEDCHGGPNSQQTRRHSFVEPPDAFLAHDTVGCMHYALMLRVAHDARKLHLASEQVDWVSGSSGYDSCNCSE